MRRAAGIILRKIPASEAWIIFTRSWMEFGSGFTQRISARLRPFHPNEALHARYRALSTTSKIWTSQATGKAFSRAQAGGPHTDQPGHPGSAHSCLLAHRTNPTIHKYQSPESDCPGIGGNPYPAAASHRAAWWSYRIHMHARQLQSNLYDRRGRHQSPSTHEHFDEFILPGYLAARGHRGFCLEQIRQF